MVYIDIDGDERLKKVKRKYCSKKVSENSAKLKRVSRGRNEYLTPEWSRTPDGTRKLEEDRLLETTRRLEIKRKEANAKCKDLVNQWNVLTEKEHKFRNMFKKFNEFTKNNRDRLEREEVKYRHHHEQRKIREMAIEHMKRIVVDYKFIINSLQEEIERHLLYEKFLERFTSNIKGVRIINVLDRYADLFDAREEVDQITKNYYTVGRKYSEEYRKILTRWNSESLRFSELLSIQSKRYEEVHHEVCYWEYVLQTVKCHAEKTWTDLQITREALNHVVCLLLIRRRARSESQGLEKQFAHILSTQEGKMMYINRMIGDFMKIKQDLFDIFERNEEVPEEPLSKSETESQPTTFLEGRSDESLIDEGKSVQKYTASSRVNILDRDLVKHTRKLEFPKLSSCTTKIIDLLIAANIKWSKMKLKQKKDHLLDTSSPKSDEPSIVSLISESASSVDARDRAMTHWHLIEAVRDHTRFMTESTPESPEVAHSKTVEYSLESSISASDARRSGTKRGHRKSDLLPIRYSCVSLTTDPLNTMLDQSKEKKMQGRIIDRNFDRYEKYCNNPTEETLMVNKVTGKLELPKLNFSKREKSAENFFSLPVNKYRRRTTFDVVLPKIGEKPMRKTKSRCRNCSDTSSKVSKTSQRSKGSQKSREFRKDEETLADLKRFLERPTVANTFVFGNLL